MILTEAEEFGYTVFGQMSDQRGGIFGGALELVRPLYRVGLDLAKDKVKNNRVQYRALAQPRLARSCADICDRAWLHPKADLFQRYRDIKAFLVEHFTSCKANLPDWLTLVWLYYTMFSTIFQGFFNRKAPRMANTEGKKGRLYPGNRQIYYNTK
jgi:hypothetical protein